jgi:WD40 repeat protein
MSDIIFSKSDRTVGLTGSIFIWNLLGGDESKKLRLLQKHKCSVFLLAFSPDGHFFASSDAIEIIIWSTEVSFLLILSWGNQNIRLKMFKVDFDLLVLFTV